VSSLCQALERADGVGLHFVNGGHNENKGKLDSSKALIQLDY
jgi:hypothetical protein